MKSFFKKLAGMFLDKNKKVSYKRMTGYICLTIAIILAFKTEDPILTGLFLTPATIAAGLVLIEKKDG